MTRGHVLMVLGALVLLSPWSGLPMAWLEWVLLFLGLAIIGASYLMRPRAERTLPPSPTAPPSQLEEPRSRSANIAFS